jgi:hypothetical protein
MFLGEAYVLQGTPRNIRGLCSSGNELMFSYVPRCHVAEEHNLCLSAPMPQWAYVPRDTFLSYVLWFPKEHNLSHKHMFLSFFVEEHLSISCSTGLQ